MAIQMEFDFWSSESPEVQAASESDCMHSLRFEAITQMIYNRHAPIWSISRKVAGAMAAAIKYSKMPVKPFQHRGPQVDLTSRMKALRELQRTLMEGEALTKRDVLDLDGPKFKFARAEIVRLFERALMDAGIDGSHAQSVMVRFDDLRTENDEALRRDLNVIGGYAK
jgi:hypothetical protein